MADQLECLKTDNTGLTSQASKRLQEYVYYSLKIEEKKLPETCIDGIVNHTQSIFAGCSINL